jgi:hypothetical protein
MVSDNTVPSLYLSMMLICVMCLNGRQSEEYCICSFLYVSE